MKRIVYIVLLLALCMGAQAAEVSVGVAYARYFGATDEVCADLCIRLCNVGTSQVCADVLWAPEFGEQGGDLLGGGLSLQPFGNDVGLRFGVGYLPGGWEHAGGFAVFVAADIMRLTW